MRIGPSGEAQIKLAPTEERIDLLVVDVASSFAGSTGRR